MIEAVGLTKRYGDTTAVDDLTFTVEPGQVTGFLGPNGAGKSTTMRLILGLDRPTSGTVTVDGKPYAAHRDPLRRVGALLEARSVHPARTARDHLLALARTHAIPRSRVDEVLELVGLQDVARGRAGNFSLDMGQRLGIASALLGDPTAVVPDEPVNATKHIDRIAHNRSGPLRYIGPYAEKRTIPSRRWWGPVRAGQGVATARLLGMITRPYPQQAHAPTPHRHRATISLRCTSTSASTRFPHGRAARTSRANQAQ